MNDIFFAAFHDELEKLSGLPSFARKAMKSGKPVGSYTQGLINKHKTGLDISKRVSAMGGPKKAQEEIYRGTNPLRSGPFSSSGAALNDRLRSGKAQSRRLQAIAKKPLPQGSPKGVAYRSGRRDLDIGLHQRDLIAGGYYKP